MYGEVRVANYSKDIGELARMYSPEFFIAITGRPDVTKHVLLRQESSGTYFVIISDASSPIHGYNMIISVMGPRKARVEELMKEVEKKLPIKTKPAPKFLQKSNEAIMNMIKMYIPTTH